MRSRLLPVLGAVAVVAGCAAGPPPQVTFRAGSASVTARPTQFCDLELQNCQGDTNAPVQLVVPIGTSLAVMVPQEVSSAPWQVVFSYRSADGTETDGRSPVLAPDQHPDYTLVLPTATDRLLTAQVQQYGPAPRANAQTGGLDFLIRASWVLTTTTG